MKKTKTAVIGVGMVGGALANVLSEPLLYDKYKKLGSLKEINRAEIIFICVPTPFDGQKGFDLSYIKNAFKLIKGKKIMVIKSTVLPGTTELFQKKYPMRYPDRQIIGYTKKSYNVAKDILQILPLAPFERIMPAAEAELVKYFGNCWFSVKVVYANQMYDLCQKLGINYESVMESAAADKRIGRSHLEIFHKGYRGYGEKCLPKDIRALIQKGDELGIDLKLLKTAEEINKILTEGRDR